MNETPERAEHDRTDGHDLVWVTSPDTTQARQYCRECGHRTEWQELPPELAPTADMLDNARAAAIDAGTDAYSQDVAEAMKGVRG